MSAWFNVRFNFDAGGWPFILASISKCDFSASQYDGQPDEYRIILKYLNAAFTALFTIESVLKMLCLGIRVRKRRRGTAVVLVAENGGRGSPCYLFIFSFFSFFFFFLFPSFVGFATLWNGIDAVAVEAVSSCARWELWRMIAGVHDSGTVLLLVAVRHHS